MMNDNIQFPLPLPVDKDSKEQARQFMRNDFPQRGQNIKKRLLLTNTIMPKKSETREGVQLIVPTDESMQDWLQQTNKFAEYLKKEKDRLVKQASMH